MTGPFTRTRTGREVRLAARPPGLPRAEHLALADVPLPAPGPGQVLVRNRWFAVLPALRTLMSPDAGQGLPLPPLRPGDALFGPAVGEVLSAPGDGHGLAEGDLVAHVQGWRTHAVLPAADCAPLAPGLPDPVAALAQGAAAYGALTRLGRVREGDTVLVTGAAGAVGTLAGQIARLLGAGRVIGSTGSPHKAEQLRSALGYDAVVLRGPGSFADRLAEAAPDGVDVLLDNVGGEQLAAAARLARPGARFALVGALSGQLDPAGTGVRAPALLDTMDLIVKGVTLQGYAGAAHQDVEPEWRARFGAWLREERIVFPYTRIAGMTAAPQALQEVIEGRYLGAVVVEP